MAALLTAKWPAGHVEWARLPGRRLSEKPPRNLGSCPSRPRSRSTNDSSSPGCGRGRSQSIPPLDSTARGYRLGVVSRQDFDHSRQVSELGVRHGLIERMQERLIVAGWVLVRPTPTAQCLGTTLPPLLWTISDCIQDDLPSPDPWLGDWFQDEAEAVRAAATVTGELPRVVTVALVPEDAVDLMADANPDSSECFDLLRQHVALDDGCGVLGFEVVGAEQYVDVHSWHCHGYADEAWERLGIRTNDKGLISTYAEARAVLTWMCNLPDSEAPEPCLWTIVALAESEMAVPTVSYPSETAELAAGTSMPSDPPGELRSNSLLARARDWLRGLGSA